jgi:hypothetical protein
MADGKVNPWFCISKREQLKKTMETRTSTVSSPGPSPRPIPGPPVATAGHGHEPAAATAGPAAATAGPAVATQHASLAALPVVSVSPLELHPVDRSNGWTIIGDFVCLDAGDDDLLKDMYRIPIKRYEKIKELRNMTREPTAEFVRHKNKLMDQMDLKVKETESKLAVIEAKIRELNKECEPYRALLCSLHNEEKELISSECKKFGHDWEFELYRVGLAEDGKFLTCRRCNHNFEIKEDKQYLGEVRRAICQVTQNEMAIVLRGC